MNHTRLYPLITILLFSLLAFNCKKKEAEPEESGEPASTLDYRNQYCGNYNVTFTTSSSAGSISETKQVTVRKAEAGETATPATGAAVEECVTLLNLPSGAGGKLTVQLDVAGKFDGASLDLNLGGKKFDLYFLNSGVSPTKTVRGQGTLVQ